MSLLLRRGSEWVLAMVDSFRLARFVSLGYSIGQTVSNREANAVGALR